MAAPGIPFYDLAGVNERFRPELTSAFERVLASSDFAVGDEVATFEAALGAETGTAHAVGVNSGTAALHLALVAAGIGRGDEVVVPPMTFFATAEAVVAAGATPVFADIDPSTALLDADAVEAAITSQTAAVIVVHLYGQPVDAGRFRALARRHDLFLLEDAAQALGGRWDGEPVGSLADAAAFSFYPTKPVGALGQGGAVTTNDVQLADTVRRLRAHGEGPRNRHTIWGWNERLDGLQAAFLAAKLAQSDACLRLRRAAADRYEDLLGGVDGVTLLATHERAWHARHLFTVRVRDRDEVRDALARQGVETGVHYPTPIHLQPAAGPAREAFPHAEHHGRHTLSLPLFPGITDEQVERVVAALTEVLGSRREAPAPLLVAEGDRQ